jgi:gliding motility associated protien GldN
LTYSLLFLFCRGFIFAQGGIETPGDYKKKSSHYLDPYYRKFYITPKQIDTLIRPQGAVVHTLWRIIDINETSNKAIFFGNSNKKMVDFFEIIKYGLVTGKIHAFRNENFANFKKNIIPPSEVLSMFITEADTVVESIFDADGNETTEKKVQGGELSSFNLQGYVLKEDWFFDAHFAKTDKRIIGLCPVVIDKKTDQSKPLFWLYYNECRQLFASFEARTKQGEDRMSFDELFFSRNFSSVICKYSNIFDRNIVSFKVGQDVFLEHQLQTSRLANKDLDFFQH